MAARSYATRFACSRAKRQWIGARCRSYGGTAGAMVRSSHSWLAPLTCEGRVARKRRAPPGCRSCCGAVRLWQTGFSTRKRLYPRPRSNCSRSTTVSSLTRRSRQRKHSAGARNEPGNDTVRTELPQDSTAVPAGDIPAEVAASSGGMERASPDQPAEIEDEVDSDEPEFEEAEETVAATSEPAQGGTEPSRPASAPRRRRRRRRGRRGRGRPQTPVAAAAGDVAQLAQPTPPTPANSEDASPPPVGGGDEK